MEWKISFVILLFSIISFCQSAVNTDIENKNVDRLIDLTSQLVKISYKITVSSKNALPAYTFLLSENEKKHLSYISIKDSTKKDLKYIETKTSKGIEYLITFGSPIFNPMLNIEIVLTNSVLPHPAKIVQTDKQLVRYFGLAYYYSPYKTIKQKSIIHLSSKNIESYSQVKPISVSDSSINCGPYDNIAPYNAEELVIHYENHTPFLTITRLERTLEISHWGNIAVEETIDILHSGAELKGSFSRYEFQKDARTSQSAVKSYKTILPASATGVYYRDTNGNISTSNMKILKDSVELDLRPRFPLYGGWKTHYTLGYNVPSFEYLFNSGDNFLLKMRVIDHVYDDMVIDEAVIKIILPESCTNIKLITPYAVQRLADDLHYTYLDILGRPVITFTKRNLVENHIHDFNLKYTFARITMLQEPLLVICFLFILFVVVIICTRLDFAITKEKEVGHHHKE